MNSLLIQRLAPQTIAIHALAGWFLKYDVAGERSAKDRVKGYWNTVHFKIVAYYEMQLFQMPMLSL